MYVCKYVSDMYHLYTVNICVSYNHISIYENQHKIGANLLVEEICLLYVSCVSYMYHISICLENEHNLGANLLGEEICLLYHIISYHISLCLLLREVLKKKRL